MKSAVFLDRDGVINKVIIRNGKPYPPATLDDLEFFPNVENAVNLLKVVGYYVIVVTNQPDVGKGIQTKEIVEKMHNTIYKLFKVDDIKVCYHNDENKCTCRKPKPGMLLEAAGQYSINLSKSYMIGDRWRDIEAGRAAGCETILVRGEIPYNERQAKDPDTIVNSLLEACHYILYKSKNME